MKLRDKYFHSVHSYIETQDRNIMLEDIINKIEKNLFVDIFYHIKI